MKLAKNPVFHKLTKHVDLHCHYICKLVEDGTVMLQYVCTEDNTTDILPKSLNPEKFIKFRGQLGVVVKITIKAGY